MRSLPAVGLSGVSKRTLDVGDPAYCEPDVQAGEKAGVEAVDVEKCTKVFLNSRIGW